MENLLEYDEFRNTDSEEIYEGKGIHPAIRSKLIDYVKGNKKCSYDDAAKYISGKMKGWKLSKEDFEEAKNAA